MSEESNAVSASSSIAVLHHPCTHVYEPAEVSLPEIMYHACFVQEGQISNIFSLVKLGWVHLAQVVGGYAPYLLYRYDGDSSCQPICSRLQSGDEGSCTHLPICQATDTDFTSIFLFGHPSRQIAGFFIRNPDVFLGCKFSCQCCITRCSSWWSDIYPRGPSSIGRSSK
jgi:hypothetical protein